MPFSKGSISNKHFLQSIRKVKFLTELKIPLPKFIKMRQDPIILLGMHRSGTSMLSKIFSSFGIHMGYRKGRLNEASFFVGANNMILEIFHTYWDYPIVMESSLENKKNVVTQISNELHRWINSYHFLRHYVGFNNYSDFYNTKKMVWGWKDPRTTITWPFWLSVFESPKFIFIYRNGIDVAESLRKAEKNSANALGGLNASLRATSLEGSFNIWEEYNQIHYHFKKKYPSIKILEICYEDLLLNPIDKLSEILTFIGKSEKKEKLIETARKINPERRYGFVGNEELKKYYKEKNENYWIQTFGYNDINL